MNFSSSSSSAEERGQSREEGISEVGEDAEQTESDNNTDTHFCPHDFWL